MAKTVKYVMGNRSSVEDIVKTVNIVGLEMQKSVLNILIGGEAGQGLVTLSQILTKALVRAGYSIVVTQSYHSRIRGGHNTYALRVADSEIQAPAEAIDILVALNMETVEIHSGTLNTNGIVVLDEALGIGNASHVAVPFKALTSDRHWNATAVGVVSEILGLDEHIIDRAAQDFFSKHSGISVEDSMKSLNAGRDWMKSVSTESFKLVKPVGNSGRMMMNGNEAIALGALSAGMKTCCFYPMTPATSISVALCEYAKKMGIIAEQAEDEISAINMAIGASFCGAPSLVPTSGGGFALMAEGLSLAGMTETPVVIALAQRPGPSTGLPTRTEQGDLEFALHAGHGEFTRAIFAPGTVEECFWLTRHAFAIADEYRIPVIIMTDQFLADCYRSVEPFPVLELDHLDVCSDTMGESLPHLTYRITENGVSPRLLPGLSKNCVVAHSSEELVIADSDEHTEDGHLTEDLSVRIRMVDKRNRKLDGLKQKIVRPTFHGDSSPDILMVCWGSTRGSVHEACEHIRKNGTEAGYLHFSQVWPIDSASVNDTLLSAKSVVVVESNSTGQFCRLLRRETGYHAEKQVLRYDGLPVTPEYILEKLGSGKENV